MGRFTIFCLLTRPFCYQNQGVDEGGVKAEDIFGKLSDWDHHRIDANIIRINQKIRGDNSQLSGLRCGIEIHPGVTLAWQANIIF